MHGPTERAPWSRRRFVKGAMAAPAAALLFGACSADGADPSSTTTSGSDASGASPSPTTTPAVAAATPTPSAGTTSTAPEGWASGGTDLITVAYPDDSIFESAATCTVSLTEATTEGPCYFHSDTGEDISQGRTGLPMQLCLQLVDTDCSPLADHVIEAWHCDARGVYSGDTSASADASSFAGDFCTAGDAEAESSTWFRGQRTTGDNGRVDFKTCFPGWYRGRTIHIHYAVTDPAGTTRVISQFCVTDELAAEICTTHDLYADRGVQDTPLAAGTDTVFPSSGYDTFLLDTRRNTDGTLLAYAVVQIDPTAVAAETGDSPAGGPRDRPEPPASGDQQPAA